MVRRGVDVNSLNKRGRTVLHLAMSDEKVDIIRALLGRYKCIVRDEDDLSA